MINLDTLVVFIGTTVGVPLCRARYKAYRSFCWKIISVIFSFIWPLNVSQGSRLCLLIVLLKHYFYLFLPIYSGHSPNWNDNFCNVFTVAFSYIWQILRKIYPSFYRTNISSGNYHFMFGLRSHLGGFIFLYVLVNSYLSQPSQPLVV